MEAKRIAIMILDHGRRTSATEEAVRFQSGKAAA
jgi:hypothetical protein